MAQDQQQGVAIKNVVAIETPEGLKVFDTKSEAMDYLRKPKVLEALDVLTNNNRELSEWIYERQEFLEDVFSQGTIRRVTKAEHKALEKAFEALATVDNLPKACNFLVDNAEAIRETFRWPTVKRISEEEKNVLIYNSIFAATENREDLTKWIIAKKPEIFAAFEAGKIKQQVPQSAADGLARYREQKRLEKEAKERQAKIDAGLDPDAPDTSNEGDGGEEGAKENGEG